MSQPTVSERLKLLVTNIKKLQTYEQVKQVSLFNNLAATVDRAAKQQTTNFRKLYEKASNLLVSMADGCRDGALTADDWKNAILEMDNYADQAILFEEAIQNKTPATTVSPLDRTEVYFAEKDAEAQRKLDAYRAYKTILPTDLKPRKFKLFQKIPIVAVNQSGFNMDRLKASKLYDTDIQWTPILKNQTVLAVDSAWALSSFDTPLDAAEHLLNELREETGKRFTVLGKPVNHGLVQYFWIADRVMLNAISAGTIKGLKLTSWSFPFDTQASKIAGADVLLKERKDAVHEQKVYERKKEREELKRIERDHEERQERLRKQAETLETKRKLARRKGAK